MMNKSYKEQLFKILNSKIQESSRHLGLSWYKLSPRSVTPSTGNQTHRGGQDDRKESVRKQKNRKRKIKRGKCEKQIKKQTQYTTPLLGKWTHIDVYQICMFAEISTNQTGPKLLNAIMPKWGRFDVFAVDQTR